MVKKILFTSLALFGLLFSTMPPACFADAAAQLEQAETFKKDGNYEQAEAIYKTVVTDYAGSDYALEAQKNLAILYINWGKGPQAQAATDKLIADFAAHPDLPEVLSRVADEYQMRQRHEQAVKLYQYVVDRWPDFIGSRGHVIMADIGLGSDANTQAAIDNLIADFNDHPGLREVLYLVGDKYHGRQKRKQAIELYQYIVDRWPESDSALPAQIDVVISNLELGKYSEAQAATDKLIADFAGHPDLPEALYHLANEFQGRQRQEKAIELYQYIVDTWPESDRALPALMGVMISNLELGNDAEAEAATNKLVTDFAGHPDLPEALNEVANEYQGWQRHEQAIKLYQYIVDTWPESDRAVSAQMDVAISNIALGDDPNAQAAIDSLIADFNDHPGLPEALYHLANQYQERRRYEKARQLYQYIVDNLPESEYVILSRGGVIMADIGLGNDANAQAAIDSLIADFNDQQGLPEALNKVADQYHDRQRYEQAGQLFQYIADNCPEPEHVILSRGSLIMLDIGLGNDTSAQAALDSLIADFNDHPALPAAISNIEGAYYIRILAAESWLRENYLHPVEIWEKVMTKFPDFFHSDPDLYYFIACCYYQLGEYEKAIEHYIIVLDNWPDHRHAFGAQRLIETCLGRLINAEK